MNKTYPAETPFASKESRIWLLLLLALTVASMVVVALQEFRPWSIQDDARQFLAWTPRLLDPTLLKGDFIADYWHSVTPPLFRLPYEVLALLGIPAMTTAKLMGLVLMPLTALSAYGTARRLTNGAPAAFLCAGLVMGFCLREPSIFSGTPRSVTVALILLFLRWMIDDKPVAMIATLTLLAALYPAPAITCLGMICLSRITLRPRLSIDLSRRSIAIVVAATVLTLGCAALFDAGTQHWDPVLKFADYHQIPAMASPNGRSRIVVDDGKPGWICSARLGFLPEVASCKHSQFGLDVFVNAALFAFVVFLAWRGLTSGERRDPRRIYALAIVSGAVCWTVAALVLFKLHLPSRFSQRILYPLEAMAVGQIVGNWLLAHRHRLPARIAGLVILAGLGYIFLNPNPKMMSPPDIAGMRAMAALPKDARIAGVAEDLSFVHAMIGRSVTADTEKAIPYQLGYYRPFRANLIDGVTLARTTDRATIADILRRQKLTAVAVDPHTLSTGELPEPYQEALPEFVTPPGTTAALASAPQGCRMYSGAHLILFSAPCLLDWASAVEPASRG